VNNAADGAINALVMPPHQHFEEERVSLKDALYDLFVGADFDREYSAGWVGHDLVRSHSTDWIDHDRFGYKQGLCNRFGLHRSIEQ
jgi:hypothetical protein